MKQKTDKSINRDEKTIFTGNPITDVGLSVIETNRKDYEIVISFSVAASKYRAGCYLRHDATLEQLAVVLSEIGKQLETIVDINRDSLKICAPS